MGSRYTWNKIRKEQNGNQWDVFLSPPLSLPPGNPLQVMTASNFLSPLPGYLCICITGVYPAVSQKSLSQGEGCPQNLLPAESNLWVKRFYHLALVSLPNLQCSGFCLPRINQDSGTTTLNSSQVLGTVTQLPRTLSQPMKTAPQSLQPSSSLCIIRGIFGALWIIKRKKSLRKILQKNVFIPGCFHFNF